MGDRYNQEVVNTLPTWAKVAVLYGDKFVFNVLLLAALLGWIPSPMTKALEQNGEQITLLKLHDTRSTDLRREILSAMEYNNMLTRTLCRNMVPTQAQSQCEPRYKGFEEPNAKP